MLGCTHLDAQISADKNNFEAQLSGPNIVCCPVLSCGLFCNNNNNISGLAIYGPSPLPKRNVSPIKIKTDNSKLFSCSSK
jgi:hypothetical protein